VETSTAAQAVYGLPPLALGWILQIANKWTKKLPSERLIQGTIEQTNVLLNDQQNSK